MAFNDETVQGFLQSKLGQSRLFLRGGAKRRLTPAEGYKYLGLTDIAPPTITRGDKITFELPSDTDGTTTASVTAAPGPYDTITMAFTQAMSRGMTEGWWSMIRERAPGTVLIPVGNSRLLSDVGDWTAAWLCDNVLLKSVGPDNNANPSDEATVATPFNLTGELEVEGEDVHRIITAKTSKPIADGTLANNSTRMWVGSAYRETEDGVEWFLVSEKNRTTVSGDHATARVSELVMRKTDGTWTTPRELASLEPSTYNFANRGSALYLEVLGNFLVVCVEGAGTIPSGHLVVKIDDVRTGTGAIPGTLISAGYGSGERPQAIYASSSGNILFAASGGRIFHAVSINSGVTGRLDTGTDSHIFRAIHGYGQQVAAVGGAGLVYISSDLGQNWRAAPATGTVTGNCTAVSMLAEDTFMVGAGNGKLYYTTDFGDSFTEISHGTGITQIQAIKFVPSSKGFSAAGYMAGNIGGTATSGVRLIARTLDGGQSWFNAKPYIDQTSGNVRAGAARIKTLSVRTANEFLAGGSRGEGANDDSADGGDGAKDYRNITMGLAMIAEES